MSKPNPSFSAWIRMPQTLIALSALLLSLCGVFIALYEASLVRRAQRASVWPYVEVTGSVNPGAVAIRVRNTGVGPARVHAATLRYRDRILENWAEMLQAVGVERAPGNSYQSLISRRVLPASSEEEVIFELTREPEVAATLLPLSRAILEGEVDLEVCFCSVFEECWTSRLQDVVRRVQPGKEPIGARAVDDCDAQPESAV